MPNFYMDIPEYMDKKIEVLMIYDTELGGPSVSEECGNKKKIKTSDKIEKGKE